ncbi:SDR family NAD(P)-dependent oxidoreductase [Streptomyces physcomitrii]|uniref:SDR family NAD(P)-dependent oxidoreductase n=1 Tax=Streptomyces physcomitrii TaxID=2724184 RepID=A0ABX1GXX4_9ACTN|nr:SDR family NAD(P)-dependent oxidoreductase [Streptomyces physcomitrii]NKI40946.1 SDR family NAD(P)-dependent oxidoreductase [Streptomyces physcomitrii]
MRTYVITGGTDGIGRALADTYLERGQQVVAVGRGARKGAQWLAAARRRGTAGRAHFLRADLGLVAENRALVARLRESFARIDALVFCARHFRSDRLVTAEGLEYTFAHFCLSRFLLGHGLAELLEAAPKPVLLNVAGPGGGAPVHWDDLQLARNYDGLTALAQGGRLNDLLGAGFHAARPGSPVRYVLFHPGVVRTGFSGQYTPEAGAQVEAMRRSAPPVEEAVPPLRRVLDHPPAAPLSAFVRGEPLDPYAPYGPERTAEEARRLHRYAEELLAARGSGQP